MRIFFDTEFMEDGTTIVPLAVGMTEDFHGRDLYIVVTDTDRNQANDFVVSNVLPYLDVAPHGGARYIRCSKADVGREILSWIEWVGVGGNLEFWADYGAYDWVLVCQLFGTMMDLPEEWPMFVRDIQQLRDGLGVSDFPDFGHKPEHHALSDAHECRSRYEYLKGLEP